jgi:hypothetical protein
MYCNDSNPKTQHVYVKYNNIVLKTHVIDAKRSQRLHTGGFRLWNGDENEVCDELL